jgi:hypothetical protein
MKQNPFHSKLSVLAIAASALLSGMVVVFAYNAFAFSGPTQSASVGSGAIGTDASNNVSVGTSTTISGTKFLVVGASNDNTTYAAQILTSSKAPVFILRNDGAVAIGTSTLSAGNTVIGGNLTVGGTLTATGLGGSTVTAGNVSAGSFGSNTGGGNYTFSGGMYFTGNIQTSGTGGNGDYIAMVGTGTGGHEYDIYGDWPSAGSLGIYDRTAAAGRLVISSTGNVGIGTTTPANPLTVVGNVNITGTYLVNGSPMSTSQWTTSSSNIYYSTGKVGVGTPIPGNVLTVAQLSSLNGTIPALGANGGQFGIMNTDTFGGTLNYGLIAGVLTSGNVYEQVQRVDGTSTAYNLLLQPNGGSVGIGTTSPGNKLEVRSDGTGAAWAGRLALSNASADRQVFLGTYNGNSIVGSHNFALGAWEPLYINTVDGSGGMFVQGNGNVGIGTTAPSTRAQIYGTLTVDATGQSNNSYSEGIRVGAASNGYSDISFGANPAAASGAQANQWWIGKDGRDNGFNMYGVSAGDALHILPSGAIGIGTISPAGKLDVYADNIASATAGDLTLEHPTSGGASSIIFPSRSNYASDYGYITYNDQNATYAYWGTTAENSALVIGSQNDGMGTVSDVVALRGAAADVLGTNTYPSTMIVNDSGNVGIGNTGPGYKLDVAGQIHSSSGGFVFPDGTTQTTAASGSSVVSAGNVSAGTFGSNTGGGAYAFPGYLQIGGNAVNSNNTKLFIQNTAGKNWALSAGANGITEQGFAIYNWTDNSSNPLFYINNAGNVGIGTTGPSQRLEVNGNIQSDGDLYLGTRGTWLSSWLDQSVTSGSGPTFNTVYTSNWFRSTGATGWYNQTYGGGWFMQDSSWVRTYNGMGIFSSNGEIYSGSGTIQTDGHLQVGGSANISGKLTVPTIDPLYTINGKNYATYVPSMTGQNEETAGTIDLHKGTDGKYGYAIDFSQLPTGSSLWLFAKATDILEHIDGLTVSLTPSFDGNVWYEKIPATHQLIIHGTATDNVSDVIEVSYRLTATRFDAVKWTNEAPADEAKMTGLIINK